MQCQLRLSSLNFKERKQNAGLGLSISLVVHNGEKKCHATDNSIRQNNFKNETKRMVHGCTASPLNLLEQKGQVESYLQVGRGHLTVPEVLVLSSLVQGGLELLAKPLGVLAALVLRHAEENGGRVSSCRKEEKIDQCRQYFQFRNPR